MLLLLIEVVVRELLLLVVVVELEVLDVVVLELLLLLVVVLELEVLDVVVLELLLLVVVLTVAAIGLKATPDVASQELSKNVRAIDVCMLLPVCDGSGGGTVERFDNASALVRSLTYRRHMRSAPQASHADQLSAVSADRRVSHVSVGQ